jgi:hypothetical protein
MEFMVQLLIALAPFALLALLAWRHGAESRPGFDENRAHDVLPRWW